MSGRYVECSLYLNDMHQLCYINLAFVEVILPAESPLQTMVRMQSGLMLIVDESFSSFQAKLQVN